MYPDKGKYVITEKERSIIAVSKLFQHGKTVVPVEVRRALNLKDGDKLVWIIEKGKWMVESGSSTSSTTTK